MTSFAVLAIVKATLVCGAALFLSRLCRRARASIRHLLFALAFTALVVIPVAGTVLPTVAVTVPATATATGTGCAVERRRRSFGVEHSFGLSRSGARKVRHDRTGGLRRLACRHRALPHTCRCRFVAGALPAPGGIAMDRRTATCTDTCTNTRRASSG